MQIELLAIATIHYCVSDKNVEEEDEKHNWKDLINCTESWLYFYSLLHQYSQCWKGVQFKLERQITAPRSIQFKFQQQGVVEERKKTERWIVEYWYTVQLQAFRCCLALHDFHTPPSNSSCKGSDPYWGCIKAKKLNTSSPLLLSGSRYILLEHNSYASLNYNLAQFPKSKPHQKQRDFFPSQQAFSWNCASATCGFLLKSRGRPVSKTLDVSGVGSVHVQYPTVSNHIKTTRERTSYLVMTGLAFFGLEWEFKLKNRFPAN